MEGGKRFFTMLLVVILALGCGFGGSILAGVYQQGKPAETAVSQTDVLPGNTAQNTNYNVKPQITRPSSRLRS